MFNHESPLRPARFVTSKIVATACRIAAGSEERLSLGRLDIARDWGWAPDFVEAMWRMLQKDVPDDYVIATGETRTLEFFVATVFDQLGLDWKHHVDIDHNLYRPSEIAYSGGNPEKALKALDWEAEVRFPTLISNLVRAEQAILISKS